MLSQRDIEQKITQIWTDVLNNQKVNAKDNFFDLGGDSLKLLRVHAELEKYLGNELNVIDLFQYSTIEALASHLHRQSA